MSVALDRARTVLRLPDFRRLVASRLASQFGDGVFQAFLVNELVFLSPEDQSTAAGVAIAFAILVIPFSLVGPFTGVVIDRWSRRRILSLTPLARAAATLALIPVISGTTDALLYALALVIVSANRFYLATAGAVLPSLVRDQDLLVSNSVAAAAGTVVTFAGLFAATQVADHVGNVALLATTALAWPISGWFASRIGRPLRPEHPDRSLGADLRRLVAGLVRGGRRVAATPSALAPIVSLSLDQFLFGVATVLSVVVFRDELRAGVASYGRILAAGGIGLLIGMASIPAMEGRLGKPRIIALSFAVVGAVGLAASTRISGPTILLLSFTIGLTYPWRKVPSDTLVQESIPDRYRGRVFALYDVAFSLPRVVAAAVAVPLIPLVSTGWMVALVGLAFLAWTPIVPWWVRRPRWVDLRFHAGGRADETPRAMVIGGEEERVEVMTSRLEERNGVRTRSFRLRAEDGSLVEVSGVEGLDRWRLELEVQEDVF